MQLWQWSGLNTSLAQCHDKTTTTTTKVEGLTQQWSTQCGRGPPPERATPPLVAQTRAAERRNGPGRVQAPFLKRTEEGQGRGGGVRVEPHGEDPEESPSPRGAPGRFGGARGAGLVRGASVPGRWCASPLNTDAGGHWLRHAFPLISRALAIDDLAWM